MNNYVKTILIFVAIIVLFVLAFFFTGSNKYESITFDEYNNLKGNNVVYIGNKDEAMKSLKEIKINKSYKVSFLNYSKLSGKEKKQVKEEVIEVFKNSKKANTYNFDSFDLAKKDKKLSLVTVNADEYLKLTKKDGLHFMFVGSNTCGYCDQFKETIKELHENYKVNVYYVDLGSLDEEGYNKIVKSDPYFSSEEWGTPTSIVYYNGQNLEVISGYRETDDVINILNNSVGIKVFLIDNRVM